MTDELIASVSGQVSNVRTVCFSDGFLLLAIDCNYLTLCKEEKALIDGLVDLIQKFEDNELLDSGAV